MGTPSIMVVVTLPRSLQPAFWIEEEEKKKSSRLYICLHLYCLVEEQC